MKRQLASVVMGVAVAVGTLSSAMVLGGCEEKITQANADKVTTGMTRQQVERILGKGVRQDIGGVSIGASGLAGGAGSSGNRDVYEWKKGGKVITITFQDDKVIDKVTRGL